MRKKGFMANNINQKHHASLKWHERLALKITGYVGSMHCAILFSIIAFISLPAAIASGSLIIIIGWLAQTFLQLVLLSIIMVGQNLQQRHAELVADETYQVAIKDEVNTEEIIKKLDQILKQYDKE
jgi:uncharacterized membrane protein